MRKTSTTTRICALLTATSLAIIAGPSASAATSEADAERAVSAIDAVGATDRGAAINQGGSQGYLRAKNGAVAVVAHDASTGVALRHPQFGEVELGLPHADSANDAESIDGTLVFDNGNGSMTSPLLYPDGSVQILTTVLDASAPTAYRYPMTLPQGATLIESPDGGFDVIDEAGTSVAFIAAPWAVDANGDPVPTEFEVDGDVLVQLVHHSARHTAYPVVADPWWGWSWTLSNSTVSKITNMLGGGASVAGLAAAICNGTVAGAIPCSAAYGVAAALFGLGTFGLNACNANHRGTILRFLWIAQFVGCTPR